MIASIVAITLLIAPEPPEGPLPWGGGVPVVPTSTAPSIVLGEMEHSEEYEDRQDEIEAQITEWSQPMNSMTDTLGVWIGEEGVLPDASGGDFNTGLDPLDEVGSAYDLAHWLGEHIETIFAYLRVAQTLPGEVGGTFLAAGLICASIILFIKLFGFGLAVFDAAYTIGRDVIMFFGAFLPTGG